jgi:hypothetical protein
MRRGYIIKKAGSETDTFTEEYNSDGGQGSSSVYCRDVKYSNLNNTGYKKPKGGSRQDNFNRDEILQRLENYIPLKTMKEKQLLTQLPNFKTWIRYYNTETKQFRTGGLLMKVAFPDYIMLVNTAKNITWSVQLKNNIIYVPDPKIAKQKEKENDKETAIKEKLFNLYKSGKLTTKE